MGLGVEGLVLTGGSPDVEFCGYSIPHPSEAKMNIRIQSYGMSLSCFRSEKDFGVVDRADHLD